MAKSVLRDSVKKFQHLILLDYKAWAFSAVQRLITTLYGDEPDGGVNLLCCKKFCKN
ncbi:UNVERIFIED_CONTAM: hypothetical protein FKN15_033448 [Acipenser sinensis]